MKDPATWLLASWTAAGIIHIRLSVNLFLRPARYWYSAKAPTSDRQIAAYLLSVFGTTTLLALSVAGLTRLAPQSTTAAKAAAIGIALALGALGTASLLSYNIKRVATYLRAHTGNAALVAAGVAAFFISGWLLVSRFTAVTTFVEKALAMAAPIACVPVVGAAMVFLRRERFTEFAEKTPAAPAAGPTRAQCRVVLMIFDEMDQRIAFDNRPLRLDLPFLDALCDESVVATDALPPCRCTEISIPAMLTGRLVDETVVSGPTSVDVFFTGQAEPEPLREQVTLLHMLRDKGFNSAVTTWYHPFGRLHGDSVVAYAWEEAPTQENAVSGPLWRTVAGFLRSLLETPRMSPFGQSAVVRKATERYHNIQKAARQFAANAELDFVFLHWPIPHAPYIYDRTSDRLGVSNVSSTGYLDNLALSDLAFGEVRADMTRAGVWDKSVVILTSDHWWRYAEGLDGRKDLRVPFAVHFPGQTHRVIYAKRFNTVATHDLIAALLDGVVTSADDLVQWLDRNGTDHMPTKV
jgi:hypothetical protein